MRGNATMTEAVVGDLALRGATIAVPTFRHRTTWPDLSPSPGRSPVARFPRIPRRRPRVGSPEWFFDALGRIEPGKVLDRGHRSALAIALPPTLCLAAAYAGTVQGVDLAFPATTTTSFSTPSTIGTRVIAPDVAPAVEQRLREAEDLFDLQFMGSLDVVSHALYVDPAAARRADPLVFFGATLVGTTDPDRFVDAVRSSHLPPGYQAVPVDAGPDARGACLVGPKGNAQWCAWATEQAVGEVSVVRDGWDADRLGAAMREVRGATEVTTRTTRSPRDLV